MSYVVKEIFYTLQGEGANVGRPAVFCRFTGCNLWSGREIDRHRAVCQFCDTDFVGTNGINGGRFSDATMLASAIDAQWKGSSIENKFVVFTGGEPLLQLDNQVIREVKDLGFWVAVETNGTLPVPSSVDWTTISPKAGAPLLARSGNELKLVYPQEGLMPESLEHLEFDHYFLQPMDGQFSDRNIRLAVQYCLANPRWRLSLQIHKMIGLP